MSKRDEFKVSIARSLARRVGDNCSNPDCRRPTSGPANDTNVALNIGVAAHITAAAPGGPRFDPLLTPAQRSAITNGIWLCRWCGTLIDSDAGRFTKELLLDWKTSAELRAKSLLETPQRPQDPDEPILFLPSADPAVSWLTFSARATAFVGRDAEQDELERFARTGEKFSWMLVVGAAGAGKSRLALELCHKIRPEWNAGFLSRTDTFSGWSRFRPRRPTLIVVDYASGRVDEASSLVLNIARSTAFLPEPVRVLLLERDERA